MRYDGFQFMISKKLDEGADTDLMFQFCLPYGGLGFGVLGLGSYIGFLGLGFSVDVVWGLWCGAFWVFWVGAQIGRAHV